MNAISTFVSYTDNPISHILPAQPKKAGFFGKLLARVRSQPGNAGQQPFMERPLAPQTSTRVTTSKTPNPIITWWKPQPVSVPKERVTMPFPKPVIEKKWPLPDRFHKGFTEYLRSLPPTLERVGK